VAVSRPLGDLTITELASGFRASGPTPVEVTRAALSRAVDTAHLGVFEHLDIAGALAASERATDELRRGVDRGPLHGVPVAVKDVLPVAGVPLTASSRAVELHPDADARAVARLRDGGAVVLGTTRTHELAFGFTTPGTKNPRDPSRTAGGSSGGSAAAVAAGICRLALGTDTAGSVRNPAALCGVVGLKPTFDLVDRGGMLPLSWSLDHVGVLAATAEEAALALDVLAGPAPADRGGETVRGTAALRIGVPATPGRTDPGVAAVVGAACAALESSGHVLVPVELPSHELALAAGFTIILSEAAACHGDLVRRRRRLLTDEVAMLLAAGELLPATAYVHAQRVRGHLRDAWWELFDVHGLDVVATPTLPITAPSTGEEVVTWADGAVEPLVVVVAGATIAHDLTGMPSVSVPCGQRGGLPVGLALTGRPFDDRTLLALAGTLA
jgi:aspartyl-tRNA(Asn)/glutamyl-tRNA(Gln) amidotransferase subunit A